MLIIENKLTSALYQSLVQFDDNKIDADEAIGRMVELLTHYSTIHHAYITQKAISETRARVIIAVKQSAEWYMQAVQTVESFKILLKNLPKDEIDSWSDEKGNRLLDHAARIGAITELFPDILNEIPDRERVRFLLRNLSDDELNKNESLELLHYCLRHSYLEEAKIYVKLVIKKPEVIK